MENVYYVPKEFMNKNKVWFGVLTGLASAILIFTIISLFI